MKIYNVYIYTASSIFFFPITLQSTPFEWSIAWILLSGNCLLSMCMDSNDFLNDDEHIEFIKRTIDEDEKDHWFREPKKSIR